MKSRKKRLSVRKVLVATAVMLSGTVYGQDTLQLDLNSALQIALSENPTIEIAGLNVEKKNYARKEVVANLFPTVTATGSYSHSIEKMSFAMQGQVIRAGSNNTFQGGFNLALPVYSPTLYKSIKLTEDDVTLALESSRASRLDLINQVSKAYYQLMLAQDSYNVLQQSYKQAQLTYQTVADKYAQGLVSEYDKLRAEVQVRNLEPSVISADNAINLTRMQLQVLIGMNVDQPIAIVGKLADYEQNMLSDYMSSDTSLVNNTELRQLKIQSEMLKKNVFITKAAYYPSLSFTAQYSWMSMSENLEFRNYRWNPYATVGLSLSIPIVNVANVFKTKQARNDVKQLALNTINVERNMRLMVNNYQKNMQNSIEQIASNGESIKQAEKACAIARKRYEVGSGTILEVNDSEVALMQARLTYHQSLFDYLSAQSDLNKVLGKGE